MVMYTCTSYCKHKENISDTGRAFYIRIVIWRVRGTVTYQAGCVAGGSLSQGFPPLLCMEPCSLVPGTEKECLVHTNVVLITNGVAHIYDVYTI